MTDYDKEEYEQLVRYIQSTWGSWLDQDWINEPKIDEIIVHLYKNEFTICVKLKANSYYKVDDGKLITAEYDPSKFIKTECYIQDETLLYMLIKGDIIHDLGLEDVKISINPAWVQYIPIDEYLSKRLEKHEESYAETMYCIAHDL